MPLFEPHLQTIFAGTGSATGPGVTLVDSNGVSFGVASNRITVSIAAITAIAAGTSTATGNQIVFSNSNGVSFGANGSVITASIAITATAALLSISAFSQHAAFETNYRLSNARISFQKVSLPMALSGATGLYMVDIAGVTNASGAFSISFGAYSMTGGTAAAVATTFAGFTWTSGAAYSSASGTRYRSFPFIASLAPGDYVFAFAASMAPGVSARIFGRPGMNVVGVFAGIEGLFFLDGVSATSAFVLPTSLFASDTGYVRTGIAAGQQPGVILVGTH